MRNNDLRFGFGHASVALQSDRSAAFPALLFSFDVSLISCRFLRCFLFASESGSLLAEGFG
jgi:hypothetical protein